MLEIIALIFLWGKMGSMLREKGWERTIWMQLAVIFVWFSSMLFGTVIFYTVLAFRHGADHFERIASGLRFELYITALLSAVVGTGILFLIAHLIPQKEPPVDQHRV